MHVSGGEGVRHTSHLVSYYSIIKNTLETVFLTVFVDDGILCFPDSVEGVKDSLVDDIIGPKDGLASGVKGTGWMMLPDDTEDNGDEPNRIFETLGTLLIKLILLVDTSGICSWLVEVEVLVWALFSFCCMLAVRWLLEQLPKVGLWM